MSHDLSEDQEEVLSGIRTWLSRGSMTKQVLTFAGYAGTGKTYLVSVLAQEALSPLAFCAFTGKAASVLARKLAQAGVQTTSRALRLLPGEPVPFEPRPYCGTIHGLCYRPCPECMVEEVTRAHTQTQGCKEYVAPTVFGVPVAPVASAVCLACDPPPPKFRGGPCRVCSDARYLRRQKLDRPYRLIIVDEASMVSDDLLQTLLSFETPILAVGDHGQLPPVRGTGSLMASPDLRLEKIHRQAEGNPIILLSARIRETGDLADELEDGISFTITPRRELDDLLVRRFPPARLGDQEILSTGIISSTNKLRVALNAKVREALGTDQEPPSEGEVLICLKNKPPVYNGMRCVLDEDTKELSGGTKVAANLWFVEDGLHVPGVAMCAAQFFEEKTLDMDWMRENNLSFARAGELYDFGYAMTCHKAQGSQFEDCIVVMDRLGWMSRDDRTRWAYTAVTRAAERLTVVR